MKVILGISIFFSLLYNGVILYWQIIGGKIIWASEYLPMNEWGQQTIWFTIIFQITLAFCLIYVINWKIITPIGEEDKDGNR